MADFIFKGFEPSCDLRQFAHQYLARILSESPSDAGAEAVISFDREDFKGLVCVKALNGRFEATAEGTDPETVIKELFKKIDSQVATWRESRFIEKQD